MDDFLKLVKQMRFNQKRYFAEPHGPEKQEFLKESKRLEKEVDKCILNEEKLNAELNQPKLL